MNSRRVSTTARAPTRKLAIDCLHGVICEHRRADAELDAAAVGYGLSSSERAFVHEMVYGALRRFFSLEADVFRFVEKKPADWLRMALIIGAYQLRHMRVPEYAAVGETVAAVRQSGFGNASGMVNAVLRRVASEPPPPRLKPHQRAELPRWLYARWRDVFGQDTVQEFCRHLQAPPPLALALIRGNRADWMAEAAARGVSVREGAAPRALLLAAGEDVRQLPGYEDGRFIVMDQGAQLAAASLSGLSGCILDVCAAPGGKTAMLAAGNPQAHVLALELRASRLPRLVANLSRVGSANVSVVQADGLCLPLRDGSAEAVFLDAPCSASGVLRRHPDARFLNSEGDIDRHAGLQTRLLGESIRVLRPGGRLVYAVCSIHRQENEDVVRAALAHGVEAAPLDDALRPHQIAAGMARVLPDAEHDGFFVAQMRKP